MGAALPVFSTHKILLVAIVALLVALPVIAWPHLLRNWDSTENDQRTYLRLGLDIKNGERLTDGNRHPLFPLLLSPIATREWSYFTTAKLLSLGITFLALALLLFLTARLFNATVALLSVALTIFNTRFLSSIGGLVISEPLLILFFILTVYFWYVGLVREHAKYFIFAGIAAGFAYLSKGTAQLIVTSFVLWAFLSGHFRRHWLTILGFIIAYLVVISPLLLYNVQTWGNPFYNFNSSHAMWYDEWDDKYLLDDSRAVTLGSYLASHDLGDIVSRFVSGARTIIQKRFSLYFPLYSLGMLFAAAAIGFVDRRDMVRGSRLPVQESHDRQIKLKALLIPVVILLVWFVFFAWYAPISDAARHFVVILPVVNTAISVIFCQAIATLKSETSKSVFFGALSVLVIFFSLYGSISAVTEMKEADSTWNVYLSDIQHNQEIDELLHGLQSSSGREVTVISGPSNLIPSWYSPKTTLRIKQIPDDVDSMEGLLTFISQIKAEYLIIDTEVVEHRPFLSEFFTVKSTNEFEMIREMPKLKLMANYSINRMRIMIFEPSS